jgi:tetratricopeptide (TPR) repeat protein
VGGYAACETWAIVHYLRLSIWPRPLVFDYGASLAPTGAAAAPYAAAVCVLLFAMAALLRRRPPIGFALLWFFGVLAPTSSVVPVALQPVAEHRMYLALIPLVALIVTGAFLLFGRRSAAVLAALALCLALATWKRNDDYRTAIRLWTDTVAKTPTNARARCNLGNALLSAGRAREGAAQLDEALRLAPDDPDANLDKGVLLGRQGDLTDAIFMIRRALSANPALAEGYFDLGWLYAQGGHPGEALGQYARAIALRPAYYDAHCNSADLLVRLGRFAEAIPHYEIALKVGIPQPELYFNLAFARIKTGSLADAIADYRSALALKPNFAEARRNLELLEAARPKVPR